MRRRGLGIAGLERQQKANEQFREAGNQMAAAHLEQLQVQMEKFKVHLEEFAKKHRQDIQKDPQFRAQFQKMCSTIGVDPIASNKGFWAELLGIGDFYYELGLNIIDICVQTRYQNGGLMDLSDLRAHLLKRYRPQVISEDDIVRAVQTLKPLGNGFQMIELGKRRLVQSVPMEFNTDYASELLAAQDRGFMTADSLKQSLPNWDQNRIQQTLDHLIRDGICWIDTQAQPVQYWVFSYWNEKCT